MVPGKLRARIGRRVHGARGVETSKGARPHQRTSSVSLPWRWRVKPLDRLRQNAMQQAAAAYFPKRMLASPDFPSGLRDGTRLRSITIDFFSQIITDAAIKQFIPDLCT